MKVKSSPSVRWRHMLYFLTCAVLFLDCPQLPAQILYRETFGTATTGGQQASQDYDWAIHTGATAINQSASTSSAVAVNRNANASKPGASDPIGQVNAGPVIGDPATAYGQGIPFVTMATGTALFWTPEYATTSGTGLGIDPTAYAELQFSWYQGNNNTTGAWRVAVQVSGQWYVSQTEYFNNAAVVSIVDFPQGDDNGEGGTAHGAELKTFTYSASAATWFALNFDGTYDMTTHTGTSGAVLTLGAQPVADLSGTIDAFGLFSNTTGASGNRRFDTYTITAIPEPGTLALLAVTGVGFVLLRRGR
jgi:hypothetical protein